MHISRVLLFNVEFPYLPTWELGTRDRAKQCFCLVFVLFFVLFLLVWVVLVVVWVLLGVVFLAPVAVVACHHFYLF